MDRHVDPKTAGEGCPAVSRSWFRAPGKNLWHVEAHREYGVLWSACGIRLVFGSAETTTALAEGQTVCPNCRR